MTEAREIQLNAHVQETKRAPPIQSTTKSTSPTLTRRQTKSLKTWILISFHIFLVLAGQAAATLLGRLYFEKGGKSTWMATLVQLVGFPILFPLYIIFPTTKQSTIVIVNHKKPSTLKLIGVYIGLGLLLAADCMLYSIGLLYLPVSTYSIICASQLAFNALFSFFLNSQKFTPYIVNSLVLLTVSAVMLVLQGDDDSSPTQHVSRGKYIIGFVCTVGASAGYGFLLPLNQLVFNKVLRSNSIKAILDMIVYQSLVSTVAIVVGLFVSGDWKTIKQEMDDYTLGSLSYLMTLIWIALNWQIFSIGSMKLLLDVSSLFSNVISTLGLPLVPVLAVFIFHDKINGGKVVAMVLAIWGFVSYGYQYYLDDRNTGSRGHEEEQNNA